MDARGSAGSSVRPSDELQMSLNSALGCEFGSERTVLVKVGAGIHYMVGCNIDRASCIRRGITDEVIMAILLGISLIEVSFVGDTRDLLEYNLVDF